MCCNTSVRVGNTGNTLNYECLQVVVTMLSGRWVSIGNLSCLQGLQQTKQTTDKKFAFQKKRKEEKRDRKLVSIFYVTDLQAARVTRTCFEI